MSRPDFDHLERLAAEASARGETFSAVLLVDQVPTDVAVPRWARRGQAEPPRRGRVNRRGRAF